MIRGRRDILLDNFRAGFDKKEAAAAMPDELVDAVALVGPRQRITERFAVWKEQAAKNQIGTFIVAGPLGEAHERIAELAG